MRQTLPLNVHCEDQGQDMLVTVVLPDYHTTGTAHATVRFVAHIDTHGQLCVSAEIKGPGRSEVSTRPNRYSDPQHGYMAWTISGAALGLIRREDDNEAHSPQAAT